MFLSLLLFSFFVSTLNYNIVSENLKELWTSTDFASKEHSLEETDDIVNIDNDTSGDANEIAKAAIFPRNSHREIIAQLQKDENDADEFCSWHKCDSDLRQPRGVTRYFDFTFLKKILRNMIPFWKQRLEMRFYLFKRDFPDCGREMSIQHEDSILHSGLNASQPTRIIIHGWMSQSRGSFNRDVKNAYLSRGDFNVIVVDWSANAANINYFAVVRMIEVFGGQLARFTQQLHQLLQVNYNDIYLIGHSLGAQIAGAAGKRIKPAQYNTIFALDPAGPRFRFRSTEFRIDPTDAQYVESIQTSGYLGFIAPTGNATFYPNYGLYQTKCYYVGCSHIRAYKMFAESITSNTGFWGKRCMRHHLKWSCNGTMQHSGMFQMGGEPSMPKRGMFYVKTNSQSPYALVMAQFEQDCLQAHNEYRAKHGCPPLKLDKSLCNYATEWAQYLLRNNTMQHRTNNKYGENIFMACGQTVNGRAPVDAWYEEIRNYNFGSGGFGMNTGHFTQVVWRNSTLLGVGVATNGQTTFVVANYNPPGNFMGKFNENVPRKIH